MIERMPIQSVDVDGVRKRGWMFANILGIAPCAAIESVVRAVGRMVVWVDADAEVSTAMIRSLSHGEPMTSLPSARKTSSELSARNFGPWKACAETVSST